MSYRAWDNADSTDRGRPRVRFDAIGEAWQLYKQHWPTWVLATLVVLVCNGVVLGVVESLFRLPHAPRGLGGFRIYLLLRDRPVHALAVVIVDGVFLGGMFRMACRQIRSQPFDVGTLFSITDVLIELLFGSAFYGLALIASSFCLLIPLFIVSGLLMFTFPLIVDAGLPATQAIVTSWRALKGQWLSATAFHLVVWFVAGIGSLFCCVGIVATAPLYSLAIGVLYRDFFMAKNAKPVAPGWDA